MEVKVFVPAGEKDSAGFLKFDLETLIPTVVQMVQIKKALESDKVKGKVKEYDPKRKTLSVLIHADITLRILQDALGGGFRLNLDARLGEYDENYTFDSLLNVACAKEAAEAVIAQRSFKHSL